MQHVNHEGLNCIYCGKLCKNKNSLAQHECRCKENPNHLLIINNLRGYQAEHKSWNRGHTKETDSRVAAGALTYHNNHLAGKHDYSYDKKSDEYKQKMSIIMSNIYKDKPTSFYCGKAKCGTYKGYYCQSSWELAFVIYMLEHNINIIRNEKGFSYIYNGVTKTYYPDFYFTDTDEYVEIKGYLDKKSKSKLDQFTEKIVLYDTVKMKPILDYVINKYGECFWELYSN